MSTSDQHALMVECLKLQLKLKQTAPEHYLNLFYTKGMCVRDWEIVTRRFYEKFTGSKRPWRKLSQDETLRAWENFRIHLYYALNQQPERTR